MCISRRSAREAARWPRSRLNPPLRTRESWRKRERQRALPVQTTLAAQSTSTLSVSPQPEQAQTQAMNFAPAVQQTVGSIPALGMTVETDPNGGARVMSTTPDGIAEWINLQVG